VRGREERDDQDERMAVFAASGGNYENDDEVELVPQLKKRQEKWFEDASWGVKEPLGRGESGGRVRSPRSHIRLSISERLERACWLSEKSSAMAWKQQKRALYDKACEDSQVELHPAIISTISFKSEKIIHLTYHLHGDASWSPYVEPLLNIFSSKCRILA
jgi:hypothetical protein